MIFFGKTHLKAYLEIRAFPYHLVIPLNDHHVVSVTHKHTHNTHFTSNEKVFDKNRAIYTATKRIATGH